MFLGKRFIGILVVMTFLAMGFGLPKKIQKRVEKEVVKVFDVSTFSMEPVIVRGNIKETLPSKITADNFFKIYKEKEILGYGYVGVAPSKTANFDYLVIFDENLKVVHTKVLVYREEYGGEIGSKRWLKQFLGKTGNDRVNPKTNIDVISGATISVQSMTKSMDNLLQTIGVLQENKIFD